MKISGGIFSVGTGFSGNVQPLSSNSSIAAAKIGTHNDQATNNPLEMLKQFEQKIGETSFNKCKKANKSSEEETEDVTDLIQMPDISGIISYLIAHPEEAGNIEGIIGRFLIDNFGGSIEEVVKNLSGLDKLSPKILEIKDQIFNTIVSELSEKAKEAMGENKDPFKNKFKI